MTPNRSGRRALEQPDGPDVHVCHGVLDMKDFEAMGVGATAGSLAKLDQADVYLGIFAYRYGYVEPPHDRSVTECEFDHAKRRGLDCLIEKDASVGARARVAPRSHLPARSIVAAGERWPAAPPRLAPLIALEQE